jgi:hypothetical protein
MSTPGDLFNVRMPQNGATRPRFRRMLPGEELGELPSYNIIGENFTPHDAGTAQLHAHSFGPLAFGSHGS